MLSAGSFEIGHILAKGCNAIVQARSRSKARQSRKQLMKQGSMRGINARDVVVRRPIDQDFVLAPDRVLGTGCSGPVIVATDRRNNVERALKAYTKTQLRKGELESLLGEATISLQIEHPHIAKMCSIYETDDSLHLVSELCRGGELFDRLKKVEVFTERQTLRAAYQMLTAIEYLHGHGVVHRDLKLENWLYEDDGEEASLKLVDFGFSVVWDGKTPLTERCGTQCYRAPEVYWRHYTDKCDMWSFGVIVYALLCGRMPFEESELSGQVLERDCSFDGDNWGNVSESCRDFIRRLLIVDSSKRMSASESLAHPWIAQQIGNDIPQPPPLLLGRSRSAMQALQEADPSAKAQTRRVVL